MDAYLSKPLRRAALYDAMDALGLTGSSAHAAGAEATPSAATATSRTDTALEVPA